MSATVRSTLVSLPATREVGPLCLVEAAESDEPAVAAVFQDLADLLPLPGPDTPEHIARSWVRHEELPPKGSAENERTYRIDEGGQTIGTGDAEYGDGRFAVVELTKHLNDGSDD